MKIYYFSGTGNSLHVARELQKRMPEAELVSIAGLLDREAIEIDAKVVGLAFPVHLMDLPIPVKAFLEKADFKSVEYVFAAATRTGTFHVADISLERMLGKRGARLDSFFILDMATNSPCGLVPKNFPGFRKMAGGWIDSISKEKIMEMEPAVQVNLDFAAGKISSREKFPEKDSLLLSFSKNLILTLMTAVNKWGGEKKIPFYADSDCNGCGVCEKVCLSGKIELAGGKPK